MDAKKLHGKGTDRQTDKQTNRQTDIATTRPNRPSGPIRWTNIYALILFYYTVLESRGVSEALQSNKQTDTNLLSSIWYCSKLSNFTFLRPWLNLLVNSCSHCWSCNGSEWGLIWPHADYSRCHISIQGLARSMATGRVLQQNEQDLL